MKIGAVVLCRYSSSRLPGKALININGKPILQYIIEKLKQIFPEEKIILATSDEESDDPLETFALLNGIKCYRGSLDNVSQRFYTASSQENLDYAIRVNGDNIFLDLETLDLMYKIAEKGEYNFISNVKNRTFPKGMSIEIIRVTYYQKHLEKILSNNLWKEHVTLYFYELKDRRSHYYHYNVALPEAAGIQLALDTQDDYTKVNKIINSFTKPHWQYNLKEIFTIWKKINEEE